VRDWRLGQLHKLPQVAMHLASTMSAEDVVGFGATHVVLATGARWQGDGIGRSLHFGLDGIASGPVLTPDDIMDGKRPAGGAPVVIYDDEGYYLAGVLAELLARAGHAVAFVTPTAIVSAWTQNTLEQSRVQKRLLELDVAIHTSRVPVRRDGERLIMACAYTGREQELACGVLVPVTMRKPVDDLWHALAARESAWSKAGIKTVQRIGDALAPGTVAAAVYAGHRYARELGEPADRDRIPFRREAIDAGRG
jgi:dimethylamine/trimethylamine dehydrogenase